MRKIFSISSALLMLGVSGLVAQTFTVTSFPHRGPSMAQSSTYLGVAIASVSVAVEETTKPCLTGVSTCAPNVNGGLSIAFPRYFLQSGQSNVVTVVLEDTSYAGPCTVDFVIKNSSSTLAWGYGPASCQPNVDTLFEETPAGGRPQGDREGGRSCSLGGDAKRNVAALQSLL